MKDRVRPSRPIILGLLALTCPAACLWALGLGLPGLGLGALADLITGSLDAGQALDYAIVFWEIRLPRILLALCAGAGLALCGAGVQAVLCNPLVSPSVLGLSAGASCGAALTMLYGGALYLAWGRPLLMAASFAAALLAAFMTYALAALRRASKETVILAGVAVSYIFSGATLFLQYLAPYQSLRSMVFWSVGSLWEADYTAVAVIAPAVLAGFAFLFSQAMPLNALALGEESAAGLGVEVRRLRLLCLVLCTLICAVIVSFTGPIGFVGLIAPHMARTLLGQDNRWLIPAAMLSGALLLLVSDSLARVLLWPREIPVGVMTSLIGGPFFLFQLARRRKDWWG